MKRLIRFALLLSVLALNTARADTSDDFVRIACVPENGLLDVDYRSLHDSVAHGPNALQGAGDALEKAGFHRPRGLAFSCQLGGVHYLVKAEQGETSNSLCGGAPEIRLSVSRDGAPLFSDVVFGYSCLGTPSVARFSIGDGPKSWRGREMQTCYATGKDSDPQVCDWTFGKQADFDKKFPADQNAIARFVNRTPERKK